MNDDCPECGVHDSYDECITALKNERDEYKGTLKKILDLKLSETYRGPIMAGDVLRQHGSDAPREEKK